MLEALVLLGSSAVFTSITANLCLRSPSTSQYQLNADSTGHTLERRSERFELAHEQLQSVRQLLLLQHSAVLVNDGQNPVVRIKIDARKQRIARLRA